MGHREWSCIYKDKEEKTIIQNVKCIQKVRNWSCIYKGTKEEGRKRSFSSKYECCSKSIEPAVVFTKREINDKYLLRIDPLVIEHTNSSEFLFNRSTSETSLLIRHEVELS